MIGGARSARVTCAKERAGEGPVRRRTTPAMATPASALRSLARGSLDLGGRGGDAPMSPRVAVVGAGMTKFVRRAQDTGKELAAIATREALASCELKLEDVDAVCLTSAPDAFDGVPSARATTWPTARGRGPSRTCAPTWAAEWVFTAMGLVHGRVRPRRRRGLWPRKMSSCQPTRKARSSRSSTTSSSGRSGRTALDLRARDAALHAGVRIG